MNHHKFYKTLTKKTKKLWINKHKREKHTKHVSKPKWLVEYGK